MLEVTYTIIDGIIKKYLMLGSNRKECETMFNNTEKLIKLIEDGKFSLAYEKSQHLGMKTTLENLYKKTFDMSFSERQVDYAIYSYFLYVLNISEEIFIHDLCINLWAFSFNYYVGSAYIVMSHLRRILELDPENLQACLAIFDFHRNPDFQALISDEERNKAKKILERKYPEELEIRNEI